LARSARINRSARTRTSTLAVWNAATGGVIWSHRLEHRPLEHVSFSPDGRLVVAGCHTYRTTVFDAETGTERWTPPCWWLNHAEFSRDGARLLLAGAFGGYATERGARLFEAKTGQALGPLLAHEAEALTGRFSPDGRRVVTGSLDFTAQVWDMESGARLTPPLRHDADVVSVEFSADGRQLVTGSADRTARVWDAASGQALTPPLPHGDTVRLAAFLPEEERLLTASADGTVCVWELGGGVLARHILTHGDKALLARFSPDGQRAATASADGWVQVWDTDTGDPAAPAIRGSHKWPRLEFDRDGRRLLTGSAIFDIATGQMVHPIQGELHASFSPDGRQVASVDLTAVSVWDAASGQALHRFLRPPSASSSTAAISPDGQRLAYEHTLGALRIMDLSTGTLVVEIRAHQPRMAAACFSPESRRVLTASLDFTARVWDAASGQPLSPPLTHRGPVADACFSRDGRQVLTASADGTAILWGAATGRPAAPALRHEAAVVRAQFSPEGRLVLTVSRDGTARVWDAATGELLLPPLSHDSPVNWTEFSPDGQWVLTASDDGTARLWSVARNERPSRDWLRLAELFTAQKVRRGTTRAAATNTPRISPLEAAADEDRPRSETDSLAVAWAELHARHPDDFTFSKADKLAAAEHAAWQAEQRLDWTNAVLHLDRLLAARPDSVHVRPRRSHAVFLRAEALAKELAAGETPSTSSVLRSKALLEAVTELTQTLDWLRVRVPWHIEARNRLLRDRRAAYQLLGRARDAHQDFLSEKGILSRPTNAGPHWVDLTDFYNAALWENVSESPSASFGALMPGGILQPPGAGGLQFDVRGLVRLDSPGLDSAKGSFPVAVRGIPLGVKCRRVHLLHAVTKAEAAEGTEAASVVFHLANGSSHTLSLKWGEDVWFHWINQSYQTPPPKPKVAWSHPPAHRVRMQLYQTTWENPRPDLPVESLDYVSAMNDPAPLLVAVTAEE
jgi:WD40 repeat protein